MITKNIRPSRSVAKRVKKFNFTVQLVHLEKVTTSQTFQRLAKDSFWYTCSILITYQPLPYISSDLMWRHLIHLASVKLIHFPIRDPFASRKHCREGVVFFFWLKWYPYSHPKYFQIEKIISELLDNENNRCSPWLKNVAQLQNLIINLTGTFLVVCIKGLGLYLFLLHNRQPPIFSHLQSSKIKVFF